ncbi:MAG: hypothetical protein IH621_06420 [Krumholzibacteria bacterium]|nr:hypothetical protein [Candidatus Krumholzibacteria bacterium]
MDLHHANTSFPRTGRAAAAVLAGLLLLAATTGGARAGLESGAADGYRIWLHALERTIAGRTASGQEERPVLYPFDSPAWQAGSGAPAYRHLAISKAVRELEEVWQDRGRGEGPPALVALANARNYLHLSEYDSALVWYAAAAAKDTAGRFSEDIARETLAAAAAAGDSLAVVRAVTNTLGLSSLEGRDGEVVLAYRWLLTSRDARAVDHLIARVAVADTTLDGRVRYWHAYALAWRGRHAESLAHLVRLVGDGGLSHGLSENERSWVLTAIPDLMYLDGDEDGARWLYRLLAGSSLPRLQLWGVYQIAGLDLASAHYGAAAAAYESICAGPRLGSWQDQACALKDVARELERIRAEGESYGTAAFFDR